ncbi:glycoside hydrolase [Plectosphaerella cucumerina]|uniref:lytic cellulose monooxygenase (C4-dehydrogenating) n=1 Tax=Plectosphaerella cucumerina TaxID=40658 RepID=A0A8K0TR96_9PEZI|nr:glycoside hydrolase [Plectosphaerella cucumerina]
MPSFAPVLGLLGIAGLAAAHGFVDNATIGGVEYEFYQPFQDPYINPAPERVSRLVQGNGPIEDVTLIDLQCGGYTAGNLPGSKPAALHAPAAAGSTVGLRWTLWPESHVGPMITYMAKCPDSGCQDYEPGTDAVFFKVHEDGRRGANGDWGSTPTMSPGYTYEFTIPECLAPGKYLVRHETIALHAAFAYPGAQFYPSCHQLDVSGSGTAAPTDLVAFPGAYSPTDPGITFDAYKAGEYKVPGPAVFTC